MKKTLENIEELAEDNYGNYIIYFFLDNTIGSNFDIIYQVIKGKIYNYCRNKFTVNFIEKAFENGNELQKKNIINEILTLGKNQEDYVISLSKDLYGNYAIQKFLENCDEESRKIMIDRINSDPTIKMDNYGKYVINKIQKLNKLNIIKNKNK